MNIIFRQEFAYLGVDTFSDDVYLPLISARESRRRVGEGSRLLTWDVSSSSESENFTEECFAVIYDALEGGGDGALECCVQERAVSVNSCSKSDARGRQGEVAQQ